jgi:hypothetical protein
MKERRYSKIIEIGRNIYLILNPLMIVMELLSMDIVSWEITTIFCWRPREETSRRFFIISMGPTRPTSTSKGDVPDISSRAASKGF